MDEFRLGNMPQDGRGRMTVPDPGNVGRGTLN